MAHQTEIVINGVTTEVTEFDHTAQEIDDVTGLFDGATTKQGALAAMGAGVRPNIGDNCCFIGGGTAGKLPVNQRGAISGSTPADSYFIDRWKLQSTLGNISYELDTDGLSLTTSEGNQGIKQTLGTALETGKTYTSSVFLANGELLTKTFAYGSVDIVDSYEDGGVWSFAIVKANDLFVWYPLIEYSGVNTVKPAYVKLEEGSTQTLAYQDDTGAWQLLPQPESDYATQLLKCQRYYYRSDMRYSAKPGYSNRYLNIPVQFPVAMRISPTVTVKSFAGTADMLSVWSSGLDAEISVIANAPDVSKDGIGAFSTGADMDLNTVYGLCIEASADL